MAGREPERVQQRDGAIEVGRVRRRARRFEIHGAEHFALGGVLIVLGNGECGKGQDYRNGDTDELHVVAS